MKITSTIPFSADVVLLGRIVEPGETVEVTDEQGTALLEQASNWTPADEEAKAGAPAKPRRTRKPKPIALTGEQGPDLFVPVQAGIPSTANKE